MAQSFHSWTFQPDQPPRAQMHELGRIARKWLELEKSTAPAVVEAIVVDHYLLPYEVKRIISQQSLTTADLTVEAVEKYQATTEMLQASRKEPRGASPPRTGGARPKNPKVSNPASPSGAVHAPGGARRQPGPGRVTPPHTGVTGVGRWVTSLGSVGNRLMSLCPPFCLAHGGHRWLPRMTPHMSGNGESP